MLKYLISIKPNLVKNLGHRLDYLAGLRFPYASTADRVVRLSDSPNNLVVNNDGRNSIKDNYLRANQYNSGNHHRHEDHEESQSFKGFVKFFRSGTLAAATIISYNHFHSDEPPNFNNNNTSRVFEELHQAILEGDERRAKILLKNSTPQDVNHRHNLGWQLIHLAAVNGRSRLVELLLENGAEINSPDKYTSPRLMAEQHNIDPMVISLIRTTEFHPDLARTNWAGTTSLHYATLSNNIDTIEVLMKYGANPTIKNEAGYKPINFASAHVAKILTSYEEEYVRREKELEEEERRKYPLEKRIKEHLVGQDSAISLVAATIRRKENGWIDEDHPLVFLFLGSSGIGKTELAKQVAKYLHKDDKKAFIRLDMSEYQEQHSVARFLGSPPGYVGHQEGGQLTEALKSCNNAVVLFDEVEKAHPKVLTVLLQLFDEGRLTDGKGNTIECKDAIFIMTSNLASEAIAEHAMQLRAEQQRLREIRLENKLRGLDATKSDEDYQETITISRKFKDTIVRPILKAHFQRDEFLGRINEMVYFLPFSDAELKQLVIKELEFWAAKAKQNNKIELTWDDRVIDVISMGYNVHYGARSIKHEIERRIINQISEMQHLVKNAKKVHVSVQGDQNNENNNLINIKIS
jgi:ATP-dependent Clp protease ATP-binding subunit ClpB